MNEIEMIEACLHGKGEEFRLIVDAYKGPMTALAVNVLGNRQDAEDVCQEAFIQAFRHLDRFDRTLSLKTWLFTHPLPPLPGRSEEKEAVPLVLPPGRVDPSPSHQDRGPDAPESGEISKALLESLTAKERSALALWANEGLNSSENRRHFGGARRPRPASICSTAAGNQGIAGERLWNTRNR